ncbi:unnamed protein product [Anisakis simplex]|uniref:Cell cycle and apoptosis regulator protein 2 (inferred by orthology to a human protein) n=1 Tax=Anisakis simplex TaxID=6269 RepID=A0A0M3JXX9_ANISI|nr:unnamed protein product [Anisakis simplex]
MSQFGAKNPAAWARPPGGQQLNAGLFQSPLIGGQAAFGGVPQMAGMPAGMINAAAFSQQAAASIGMNLSMLQSPQQAAIRMQTQQQNIFILNNLIHFKNVLFGQCTNNFQQPQQKNRTFSGVVTKMHDSYGFIDDDVFFQVSVVRGTLPRTGDRVMVEASYNPTMPFKWNAFRVQLISSPDKPSAPQMMQQSHQQQQAAHLHAHSLEMQQRSRQMQQQQQQQPSLMGSMPPSQRGNAAPPMGAAGGGAGMGTGGGGASPWSNKSMQGSHQSPLSRPSEPHMRESRPVQRSRSPPPQMARRGGPMPGPDSIQSGRRMSPPMRRSSPPRNLIRRSTPKRCIVQCEKFRSPPPSRNEFSRNSASMMRSPPPSKRNSSPPPRRHDSLKRERSSPSGSMKKESVIRDSLSPPRRRARIIPRYHCHIPKLPIAMANVTTNQSIIQLRRRYASLYIPSDFIEASIEWTATTPLDNPIAISTTPTIFHVLHKDVDQPKGANSEPIILSPPDADSRFSAKVILLAHGGLSTIQQKAYGLMADGSTDDGADPTPLSRCLSFLVGTRGKGEMTALGGAWSKSLDGDEPESDPQVLVRTAIRTVRALTGVDLSKCTKCLGEIWDGSVARSREICAAAFRCSDTSRTTVAVRYARLICSTGEGRYCCVYKSQTYYISCNIRYKMAQLRYHRADKERVDTSVLFLPDTSTLMPDDASYREQLAVLKNQLATKIASIEAMKLDVSTASSSAVSSSNQADDSVDVSTSEGGATSNGAATNGSGDQQQPQQQQQQQGDTGSAGEASETTKQQVRQLNTLVEVAAEEDEDDEDDLTPTHWSKLDIKTMKVAELRQELMARDLETKGIKSVLFGRLQAALNEEKAKEEGKVEEEKEKEIAKEKEQEKEKDKEKVSRQRYSAIVDFACNMPFNELYIVIQVEEEKPITKEEPKEGKELTEEEKKALEKLEKEKKEKKLSLERHYAMPKETGILVHPSRLAKGGKFDCKVVSLHNLLDYRIDDCKEHTFELAIMVECITEMLDRSHAFGVYKSISCALDKDAEKKRRNEAKIVEFLFGLMKLCAAEVDDKSNDKSEEQKKKDEEKREEERKKALGEPRKAIVVNRSAFSAFCYFDRNLCGYLIEKDVEEILLSIGLNVSRAHVQKLLKKLSSHEKINYRHLTDSWLTKDGTVQYKPGVLDDAPDLDALCKGTLVSPSQHKDMMKVNGTPDVSDSGTVLFNGSLMNVVQMIHNTDNMQAERNNALQKVDMLEAQLKESAKNSQLLEKKKKRLEDDVDKYRKRLHDAEKCLKNSVDDTVQMKSTIQEYRKIGERMIGLAEKIMPSTKEDDREERESSKRDKKEDKDEKKSSKKEKTKESESLSKATTGSSSVVEEKKELQLVDEIVDQEQMDTDAIVLSEEVGDDETAKEATKDDSKETNADVSSRADEPKQTTE